MSVAANPNTLAFEQWLERRRSGNTQQGVSAADSNRAAFDSWLERRRQQREAEQAKPMGGVAQLGAGIATGVPRAIATGAQLAEAALEAGDRVPGLVRSAMVNAAGKAITNPVGVAMDAANVVASTVTGSLPGGGRTLDVRVQPSRDPRVVAAAQAAGSKTAQEAAIGKVMERGAIRVGALKTVADAAADMRDAEIEPRLQKSGSRFMYDLGQSVPGMAVNAAAAVAGTQIAGPKGGLAASGVVSFMLESGDTVDTLYQDFRDDGMSKEDAYAYALMAAVPAGTAKAAIEQAGFQSTLIRGMSKVAGRLKLDKQTFAKAVTRYVGDILAEGGEEVAQGTIDRIVREVTTGKGPSPVSREAFDQAVYEFALGAAGGALFGAPGSTIEYVAERRARNAQTTATSPVAQDTARSGTRVQDVRAPGQSVESIESGEAAPADRPVVDVLDDPDASDDEVIRALERIDLSVDGQDATQDVQEEAIRRDPPAPASAPAETPAADQAATVPAEQPRSTPAAESPAVELTKTGEASTDSNAVTQDAANDVEPPVEDTAPLRVKLTNSGYARKFLVERAGLADVDEDAGRIGKSVAEAERGIAQLNGRDVFSYPELRQEEYRSDEARTKLRKQAIDELMTQQRLDDDDNIRLGTGGALPKTPLRKDRVAVIVLGPPAAGKSGIANRLSDSLGAMIVDNDYAKRKIPEFHGNPLGAMLVHTESDEIINGADGVRDRVQAMGANMVIPVVGKTYSGVAEKVRGLKADGYTVRLVNVVLPTDKVLGRAARRYDSSGRYVSLSYIAEDVGEKPSMTYDRAKKEGLADEYLTLSTDVERGQPWKQLEGSLEQFERAPDDSSRLAEQTGRGGRSEGSGSEQAPSGQPRKQPADDGSRLAEQAGRGGRSEIQEVGGRLESQESGREEADTVDSPKGNEGTNGTERERTDDAVAALGGSDPASDASGTQQSEEPAPSAGRRDDGRAGDADDGQPASERGGRSGRTDDGDGNSGVPNRSDASAATDRADDAATDGQSAIRDDVPANSEAAGAERLDDGKPVTFAKGDVVDVIDPIAIAFAEERSRPVTGWIVTKVLDGIVTMRHPSAGRQSRATWSLRADQIRRNEDTTETGEAAAPTPAPAPTPAENAAPAAPEPVATPEPARDPNAVNHIIRPGELDVTGGVKAKMQANLAALELLQKLETEGRNATASEKRVLANFTGWGWAGEVFNEAKPAFAKDRAKLQELMTEAEYASARKSTLNAHYTAEEVVRPMWDLVKRLGFKGGRVLEPAAGSGNFLGMMPEDMRESTQFVAVELDSLTGRLLRKLYPESDVRVQGFETAQIANNSIDLAISNVPFGGFRITGRDYDDLFIHDYFFARALDKLRPGGLLVFVTSDGTLNKVKDGARVRQLLASKADLVGAIRLPNDAFAKNAGTQVTTDIIVMRKKDGTPFQGEPFINLAQVGEHPVSKMIESLERRVAQLARRGNADAEIAKLEADIERYRESGSETVPIMANEYFAAHPEMALGRHTLEGTMYNDNDYALVSRKGVDLGQALQTAINALPENVVGNTTVRATDGGSVKAEEGERFGSYVERDGVYYVVGRDGLEPADWTKQKLVGDDWDVPIDADERARRIEVWPAWNDLRKAAVALVTAENSVKPKSYLDGLRAELNRAYDAYVKKFGTLNRKRESSSRIAHLAADPDYPLVISLEVQREVRRTIKAGPNKGKSIIEEAFVKHPIFEERQMQPRTMPTSAKDINEAVSISLGYRNTIDPAVVGELLGISSDDAQAQVLASGLAFVNPTSGMMEPKTKYLSGNVRRKLVAAREAAQQDERYAGNVTALEAVVPRDVDLGDITYSLASRWMPEAITSKFASDLFATDVEVRYVRAANGYDVSVAESTAEILANWTVRDERRLRMSASQLLTHALNNTRPVVTETITVGGQQKTQVLQAQTAQAQALVDKMNAEFVTWLRTTDAMIGNQSAQMLAMRMYNDTLNAVVPPVYDGSHLVLPGASKTVRKTPHRMSVVYRILQEGAAVMAHGVGSGKTFSIIVSAMEMRRLGLARKPMIVVQKATLGQFVRSFKDAYPAAKILVATNKTFAAKNRKRLMAQVALGDWDAVICTHPQFDLISVGAGKMVEYLRRKVAELESLIQEERRRNGKKAMTTKQLEAAKASLEAKIAKTLEAAKDRQDVGVKFEDMGIDAVFIDEAHMYKNVPIVTRMQRVKGIPQGNSDRALLAEIKLSLIQERQNGRGVVLATGTPITNSMAEAYVMLKLATPKVLSEFNIENFDEFANTFGQPKGDVEFTYAGRYEVVTRFKKFVNGPELIRLIRAGFDVKMGNAELGLDVPRIKGGQPEIVTVPGDESYEKIKDMLMSAVQTFETAKGLEKRELSWVPITVMQAGMAAALDPRLIDANLPDSDQSKLSVATRRIVDIYRKSSDYRGTQIVFADKFNTMDTSRLRSVSSGGISSVDGLEIDGENETLAALRDDDTDAEAAARNEAKADDSAFRGKGFNLHKALRDKLIDAGIPAGEIALVMEANTDQQREALFERVNRGEIRVIIGTTDRLGVGVNIQQRLVAMHELDPPRSMTPAMSEQREGRIVRQGNLFATEQFDGVPNPEYRPGFEIELIKYGMKGSMDIAIYGIIANKRKFIVQALTDKGVGRTFDDPGDQAAMTASQMKAQLADDPELIRAVELDQKIDQLSVDKESHERQQLQRRQQISEQRANASFSMRLAMERAQKASSLRVLVASDVKAEIYGEKFTGEADIKEALKPVWQAAAQGKRVTFTVANVPVTASQSVAKAMDGSITASVQASFSLGGMEANIKAPVPGRFFSHIRSYIEETPAQEAQFRAEADRANAIVKTMEAQPVTPWAKQAELDAAVTERAEIEQRLIKRATESARARNAPTPAPVDGMEVDGALVNTGGNEAARAQRGAFSRRRGAVYNPFNELGAMMFNLAQAAANRMRGVQNIEARTQRKADKKIRTLQQEAQDAETSASVQSGMQERARKAANKRAAVLQRALARATTREQRLRERGDTESAAYRAAVSLLGRARRRVERLEKTAQSSDIRLGMLQRARRALTRDTKAQARALASAQRRADQLAAKVDDAKLFGKTLLSEYRESRSALSKTRRALAKTMNQLVAERERTDKLRGKLSDTEQALLEKRLQVSIQSAVRGAVTNVARELPVRLRGNFITQVRDARSLRDVLDAMQKADELQVKDVTRTARKIADRMTSRKVLGRMTEDARTKLADLKAQFDDNYRQATAPLASAGLAADELVNIAEQMRAIVHEVRVANKLIRLETWLDADAARVAVLKAMQKRKQLGVEDDGVTRKQPGWFKEWFVRGNFNARTIAAALDDMWVGMNGTVGQLFKAIEDGALRSFELREAALSAANVAAMNAGYQNLAHLMAVTSGTLGEGLHVRVPVRLAGENVQLTYGQLAKLYSTFQDVSTWRLIRQGKSIRFRDAGLASITLTTITDKDVDAVRDALPPALREAIDEMKRARERMFPAVQAVIRAIKGYEPIKEFNYEPRTLDREVQFGAEEMELFDSEGETRYIENAGFTINRKEDKTTPLLIGDFFEDWTRTVNGQADVIALAAPIRNARLVLLHPDVKQAVAGVYGDRAPARIKDILIDASGLRNAGGKATRVAQFITRMVSASRTALRLTSWMAQLAGVPRLWAAMRDNAAFMAGLRGMFKKSTTKGMMEISYVRRRYAGSLASVNSTLGDPTSAVMMESGQTLRDLLGRASLSAKALAADVKVGDVTGAAVRAWVELAETIRVSNWFDAIPVRIAYAGYSARAKKLGMDETWVQEQTVQALREVLNSSDATDLTAFASKLRNNPGVVMTAFTSDAASAFNQLYRGWRAGGKERRRAVIGMTGSILYTALGAGLIDWIFSSLVGEGKDDEERLTQAASKASIRAIQESFGMSFMADKLLGDVPRLVTGLGGGRVDLFDSMATSAVNQTATSAARFIQAMIELFGEDEKKADRAGEKALVELMKFIENGGSLVRNPFAAPMASARRAVEAAQGGDE
jgi:N12 class adenine-specific DNA methylase